MRKYLFAAMGILLLGVMAWAGDVWKDKPYDQWTEKDVLTVLQFSPWAKANVSAAGAWRPLGTAPTTGSSAASIPGTGMDNTNNSAGSLAGESGGLEKNANAVDQPYNVYWWSSRTIRKAFVRYSVLKGRVKPEDAPKMVDQPIEDYQVLVQGQNMHLFEQRGEKAFQDAAYLEMKESKEKILPSQVVFQLGPDGKSVSGVVFHFPKPSKNGGPAITPNEKQVYFYLRIGRSMLRTYFEPKKMLDAKGEDL
jgi:hypothetical protein